MHRILLITTGGTIASTASDRGFVPGKLDEQLFAGIKLNAGAFSDKYADELQEESVRIDTLDLFCKDSSCINPSDWISLIDAVKDNAAGYDGIVITHGTDTMAYTGCALKLALDKINIPVCLTGSQRPQRAKGSDAKDNLMDSVRVALSGVPGVFIVFAGRIICADRAAKVHSQCLEAFESINAPYAGFIKDGIIKWNESARGYLSQTENLAFFNIPEIQFEENKNISNEDISGCKYFNSNIAVIKLFPGCDAQVMDLFVNRGVRGIIIEGFGLGGAECTKDNDWPAAIKQATDRGVVVIITSQCRYDGTDLLRYEVGVLAKRAGAIDAGDLTTEAATVRLMWTLAHKH